jgi:hypothetical protein
MKRFGFTSLILAGFLAVGLHADNTIKDRKQRQQHRIGEGIEHGQLTPKEAAGLEHKEAKLNKEIRNDREDHNGHLTKSERKQVNRQQNKLSKQIYREKHDGNGK